MFHGQVLNFDFLDKTLKFFYNSLFSAKSWQNSASIDGKKQNKNCPQSGLNPQSPDLHSNALPTELGRNLLDRRFLKLALFHAPLHVLDFDYFWNQ